MMIGAKMLKILLLSLLTIVLDLGVASAQTNAKEKSSTKETNVSLDEVIMLQKKISSSKYLAVDFEQERKIKGRPRVSKKSGRATFSRPNSFRWSTTEPKSIANMWIFNGQQLFDYQVTTNEAVKYEITGSKAKEIQSIVRMVLDIESLLKRYTFENAVRTDDLIKIKLLSDGKDSVEYVNLLLDEKNEFISDLEILFRGGNQLKTLFSNPDRSDVPVSAFLPPKGVKITEGGI